jgi:DNA-binding NarL/FixJ family response regulator
MPSAEIAGELRILLADDDANRRALLRGELENAGFAVCADESIDRALEAARRECPDVLLLDVRASGPQGIAIAGKVKEALPETKVIVMNAEADEEGVTVAARIGVEGYLPEDVDSDRLPDVIRAVAAGEAAYPRGLLAPLLAGLRGKSSQERRLGT